jgi:hypothetical protein
MNKEQIKLFIESYEPMMKLIEETVNKLEKVDYGRWFTGKGIISSTIGTWQGLTTVDITYDTSCMGCYSEESTSFPADWLLLSDEELIRVATEDRDERRRVEKEKAKAKKDKEMADKEAKEREQYEKLKTKFESDSTKEVYTLTNDDDGPFDSLQQANPEAEIFYPNDVMVLTKDGLVLCETIRCNAWQPDGAYSYSFNPKK